MLVFESPGRVSADQRRGFLVGPAAGKDPLAHGERAGAPLAQTFDVGAAQRAVGIGVKRVAIREHAQLAVNRR